MKTNLFIRNALTVLIIAGLFFATPALSPAASAQSTCGDTYVVRAGDTMRKIAQACGITLQSLIAANPEVINPNLIFPGQVLRTKPGVVIPPTGGQTYIVQRGDTLRIIANRFGTTVDAILRLNPQITNANRILVGQSILLPEGVIIPPTGDQTYIVQRGDTLRIIANRFGTTVAAILQLNPQITNPNLIFPGQVIRIGAGAPPPPPPDGFQSYIVQRGDTLRIIAARFGTTVQALIVLNPQISSVASPNPYAPAFSTFRGNRAHFSRTGPKSIPKLSRTSCLVICGFHPVIYQ
jgi:LysM repeat protein